MRFESALSFFAPSFLTSLCANRRSKRDFRFSQGGMADKFLWATWGRCSKLLNSIARCWSSTSMELENKCKFKQSIIRLQCPPYTRYQEGKHSNLVTSIQTPQGKKAHSMGVRFYNLETRHVGADFLSQVFFVGKVYRMVAMKLKMQEIACINCTWKILKGPQIVAGSLS